MVNLDFRTKKNGVPVLSRNNIEDLAEIIIGDYNKDILEEPTSLDIVFSA